jgi:hypothetical protein
MAEPFSMGSPHSHLRKIASFAVKILRVLLCISRVHEIPTTVVGIEPLCGKNSVPRLRLGGFALKT